MQVRQLLEEDDAVSPVIGVILMVAITVILAAVIASFVLGLGQQQQTTPTVSFSSDYTEFNNDQGNVTISHDGGDTVRADEIIIRGENGSENPTNYNDPWVNFTKPSDNLVVNNNISGPGNRTSGTNSSTQQGEPAVVAGDSIEFPVGSDGDLDIVYDPVDSSSTATLHEWTGPDA